MKTAIAPTSFHADRNRRRSEVGGAQASHPARATWLATTAVTARGNGTLSSIPAVLAAHPPAAESIMVDAHPAALGLLEERRGTLSKVAHALMPRTHLIGAEVERMVATRQGVAPVLRPRGRFGRHRANGMFATAHEGNQ